MKIALILCYHGFCLFVFFPTEGNSKPLAGVLSAIVVSAVGAVLGYFAYQKKKLCFKNREGNYIICVN